jgi:hypothetical protein
MISPTETPFLSMAKRKKADNRLHQWLMDKLTDAHRRQRDDRR